MAVPVKAQPQQVTGGNTLTLSDQTIQLSDGEIGVNAFPSGSPTLGGTAILNTVNISPTSGSTAAGAGGLEIDGNGTPNSPGSSITGDNVHITLGDDSGGAHLEGVPNGCSLTLTNSTIKTGNLVNFNGGEQGVFIFASAPHDHPNFVTLNNVDITVGSGGYKGIAMEDANLDSRMVFNGGSITAGAGSTGVSAEFEGANITLNNSKVTVGDGGIGLQNFISFPEFAKIFTNNTNVIVGNNGIGAFFFGGGSLSMTGGSLSVGAGGIGVDVIAGKPLTEMHTSIATFDGTTVTSGGTGINVEGSAAEITFEKGASIVPGNGLLLSVKGTDFGPPDGFQPSAVTLTADTNAKLTGDIVTADDGSTLDVNLLNNSTLTGVIERAHNLFIDGAHNPFIDSSTWIMPNDSFITGNLFLLGNLIVNSTAKFAATGEASVLTIGGNLSMGSGSTTSLGIGGRNPEQYDRIVVGGSASVSGKLVVNSLGDFHPIPGDVFGILRSGGIRSGNWGILDESNFNTLAATPPGQLRPLAIEVVAPNGIDLVYLKETTPPIIPPTPIPPTHGPAPGPTPPVIVVDPNPLPPVDPEEPIPPSFLLSALDPTVEQLTSLYEISFSGANLERFSLGDRMFQIQQGMTGFVSQIAPVPTPSKEGLNKEANGEEGKKELPPAYQPGPQNRWGIWISGSGNWVDVNSTNDSLGYRFTAGSVSVGVDYLVIPGHLAIGAFGAYSHTRADLSPSGRSR